MRALGTGGSGFLGRNLIAGLVARGDTVRALARTEAAARDVRAAGAEPVTGDLDDAAALERGMAPVLSCKIKTSASLLRLVNSDVLVNYALATR